MLPDILNVHALSNSFGENCLFREWDSFRWWGKSESFGLEKGIIFQETDWLVEGISLD